MAVTIHKSTFLFMVRKRMHYVNIKQGRIWPINFDSDISEKAVSMLRLFGVHD